ncbi:MAG: WG repeat-containing protein [Bacteroidota bacterium]
MLTRLIICCCCMIPLFVDGQQLRVAKDNLLCAYGLKNDQQKWVVSASFVTLEPLQNGVFKTFDGQLYGLLNAAGKEIIPPTYDKIEPNDWGGYKITQDEKIGFINRSGELKIAPEYARFKTVRGGKILLYRSVKDSLYMTYYTTYADTNGKILLPEQQGIILPFSERKNKGYEEEERPGKPLAFIGTGFYGFDNVIKNVGVIDENGKEVIPRIYDRMDYRDEQSFWVWKNEKLGAISRSGQIIIEPKFTAYAIGEYGKRLDIRGNTDRLLQIVGEDGKSGLMHTSGKVVLEPKYDEIKQMYPNMVTDSATYLVHSGDKTGIAGKNGSLTFDLVYDTLIPIAIVDHKAPYGQQVKATYFFFRQQGKYGLMKGNGKILVQPCYDAFVRSYEYGSQRSIQFLSDKTDILLLEMSGDSLIMKEMKSETSFEQIQFFSSGDLLYPFKKDEQSGVLTLIESFERTKYLIIVREKPRENKNLLFDTNGKLVGGKNIRYVGQMSYDRYVIVGCENNKAGLYDAKGRKWILDTVYLSVKLSNNGVGNVYFWGQIYPPKGEHISAGWQVFDTLGKQKTSTIFTNVITGGDTLIVESNGSMGVVNGQLEWIIEPLYEKMHRLASSLYGVYTKTDRFGLVNASGKRVVDTIYTGFEPVYEYVPYYDQPESAEKASQWWLFTNDNERLLVNNEGKKWSSKGTDTEQRQLKELLDDFVLRGNRNHASGTLNLIMDPILEAKVRKSAIKHDLITHVRSEYVKTPHCNDFYRVIYDLRTESSPCYGAKNYIYQLIDCGNRFYTLKTSDFISRYSMEMPMEPEEFYFYYNAIKVGNDLREVRLSDIFGTGNVLQEELLRIIKERDDLDLDCSSPENMVGRLEGRFSLSDKGVRLYYNTNTVGTVEFLIPNSRLTQHAESKWILPYLSE